MKHLLRRLSRSPLFTAMTLVTLAVGIGANTAVFSVVNGVLIKPLPFRDPARLAGIGLTAPGLNIEKLPLSSSTYFLYREEGRSFEDIGLWGQNTATVTGLAEPEEVPTLSVTQGALPILGAQPAIGRWFSAKDDPADSPLTVMLTFGYWQQHFGGDRGVIGRTIMVNSRPREIVGVMPRHFHFMNFKPSLIIPYQLNRNDAFIGGFNFQAVGRLRPGV